MQVREVIAAAVAGVADEERDASLELLPPWLAAAHASASLPVYLFTPSAIMLVSHHPLFAAMKTTLVQLMRLSVTPDLPLPLERYVAHCVFEVPLPPRGRASVGFTLGDRHMVIARPPPNELPTQDVSLRLLFQCLDLQNLLTVFTVMLCEARFALCSVHEHILTPVASALCSLLFPFRWVVSYIPVLPLSMGEVLGSPATFIIGFPAPVEVAQVRSALVDPPLHSILDTSLDGATQKYAADITLVDLDTNRVHIPPSVTTGGGHLARGLPRLPETQRRKLEASLRRFAYGSMEADSAGGTRWFGFSFGGGGGPKSRYPAGGMYGANVNPELSRGGRLTSMSHAVLSRGSGKPTPSASLSETLPHRVWDGTSALAPLVAAATVSPSTKASTTGARAGQGSKSTPANSAEALLQVSAPWDPPRFAMAGTTVAPPPPRHFVGTIELDSLHEAAVESLASGWVWPTHEEALAAASAAATTATVNTGLIGGAAPASTVAAFNSLPPLAPPLAQPQALAQTQQHMPPLRLPAQAAPPTTGVTAGTDSAAPPVTSRSTRLARANATRNVVSPSSESAVATIGDVSDGAPLPLQLPLVISVQVDDEDSFSTTVGSGSTRALSAQGKGVTDGRTLGAAAPLHSTTAAGVRLTATAPPLLPNPASGSQPAAVLVAGAAIGSSAIGPADNLGAGGPASSTPAAGPVATDDALPTNPSTGLSDAFSAAGIRTAFAQFFVGVFKNYARSVVYALSAAWGDDGAT